LIFVYEFIFIEFNYCCFGERSREMLKMRNTKLNVFWHAIFFISFHFVARILIHFFYGLCLGYEWILSAMKKKTLHTFRVASKNFACVVAYQMNSTKFKIVIRLEFKIYYQKSQKANMKTTNIFYTAYE